MLPTKTDPRANQKRKLTRKGKEKAKPTKRHRTVKQSEGLSSMVKFSVMVYYLKLILVTGYYHSVVKYD